MPSLDDAARKFVADHELIDPLMGLAHYLSEAFKAGARWAQPVNSVPGAPRPTPTTPGGWRELVHAHGDLACGQVALYLTEPVIRGTRADLSILRMLPDLRAPTPADAPRCGSCGSAIDPYSTQDLDWAPHIVDHVSSPLEPQFDPWPGALSQTGSTAADLPVQSYDTPGVGHTPDLPETGPTGSRAMSLESDDDEVTTGGVSYPTPDPLPSSPPDS